MGKPGEKVSSLRSTRPQAAKESALSMLPVLRPALRRSQTTCARPRKWIPCGCFTLNGFQWSLASKWIPRKQSSSGSPTIWPTPKWPERNKHGRQASDCKERLFVTHMFACKGVQGSRPTLLFKVSLSVPGPFNRRPKSWGQRQTPFPHASRPRERTHQLRNTPPNNMEPDRGVLEDHVPFTWTPC